MLLFLLACSTPSAPPAAVDLRLEGNWRRGDTAVVLPRYMPVGAEPLTRRIDIPEAWAGARAELILPATGWRVSVSVDGRPVGEGTGGLWPARVDLGAALGPGPHELTLTVEAPTPTTIVPGETHDPVATWLYRMPPVGDAVVRGPPVLRIHGASRVDRVEARLIEGGAVVEATAWTRGLAVGTPVDLRLVRDGAVVAELPDGVVDADGRARVTAPWSGPRWPAPEGLVWVVAEGPDGARAQARVGLRSVDQEGRKVRLNGEPVYLAASRLSLTDLSGRGAFAAGVARIAAAGSNAVEIHGEMVSPLMFEAADELGIPVVWTPRCDGQRNRDGRAPDSAARDAFVTQGDILFRDAARHHPSLLLWVIEAERPPGLPSRHPTWGEDGLVVMDEEENGGCSDPSLEGGFVPACYRPFLGELPWAPRDAAGVPLGPRLAPLLAQHIPDGAGLVVPGVPSDGRDPAQGQGLRDALAGAGIAPYRTEPRRGPATARVDVTRGGAPAEGVVVLLEVPGLAPFGGVTDGAGTAWIEAHHSGPARVVIPGTDVAADLTLTPGTWSPPSWTHSVSAVALDLPG